MGLFFPDDTRYVPGHRAVGFARYKQVLEGSFKEFFLVGLISLVSLIPFGLGMVYAVLSSSSLAMLAAAVVGGAISGPGIACMYDILLRRLRNDRDDWWRCFKKALGQNWRASILPGIVQCLFLGGVIFFCAMLWWAQRPISFWTVAILALSFLLFLAVLSVWWPQVVLFDQRPGVQLKNTLLFLLTKPDRCLGAAAVQLGWWTLAFLFLPWTAFLVPFLNTWYILFVAQMMLYRPLDEAMHIEEQIRARFPHQIWDEEDE